MKTYWIGLLGGISKLGLPLKIVIVFIIYIGAMVEIVILVPTIGAPVAELAMWLISQAFGVTMLIVLVAIFAKGNTLEIKELGLEPVKDTKYG